MDLVVLLSSPPSPSPSSLKGKEKQVSVEKTKVSLWRMTGSKVWEVQTEGRIFGLVWSLDGLHLSLLTVRVEDYSAKVHHISVHDGRTERVVLIGSLQASAEEKEDLEDGSRWWDMTWTCEDGRSDWPADKPGSTLMMIDSLPRVTPVQPPKPQNVLPFMLVKPIVDPSTLGPHHKLDTFPALLPSQTLIPPDILHLVSPKGTSQIGLLTGTFPVPFGSSSGRLLLLARISDKMAQLLDVVLKGVEAAEASFRDAEKQTVIWREELEICGDQQGMTKDDVHADLFRLLMTGRHGAAIGDWLGNRLTGRAMTKWEMSALTGFKAIGKVISESITPALEYLILLLEELRGWSLLPSSEIDKTSVIRTLDAASGMTVLMERIRQEAEAEMLASADFIKWLKYEIARTTSHDPNTDTLPSTTYDVKTVWSFLTHGFLGSTLSSYFPQGATKLSDPLPVEASTQSSVSSTSLKDVLKTTLQGLSHHPEGSAGIFASPPMPQEESFTSSHILSSPEPTPAEAEISTRASSPDSIDPENRRQEGEEVIEREIESEPWIWATSLVERCEGLIRSAVEAKSGPLRSTKKWQDPGGNTTWICLVPRPRSVVWLVAIAPDGSCRATAFRMSDTEQRLSCLALDFFDDTELVLLLANRGGESQRYLATMEYPGLEESLAPVPPGRTLSDLTNLHLDPTALAVIPLARCRPLDMTAVAEEERPALALNGRQGRRVGCVSMGDGRIVQVFDMDEDEGEDEEEEEDADMDD
ncbi:hypothetical protein M231_07089 [Tremella mesenterica]|uniref:Anaphase-promoting complex subunit 4 n=1 Tax=Tremella mesenterica TaxID=5217 RepID=A0A4Q1BA67_TREME|nr:hypothetical protein M231_07089 [Tremella mesenterica]